MLKIYNSGVTEILLFIGTFSLKPTKYISEQAKTNHLDLTTQAYKPISRLFTQPLHYPTSAEVKDLQEETGGDLKEVGHAARMPGFTSGAPYWVQKVGWVW